MAVTPAPFTELKLTAGLHVYVVAPLALNNVLVPTQIVAELEVIEIAAATVTELVAELVQVPFVPIIV